MNNNTVININDHISYIKNHTRLETAVKIQEEIASILNVHIAAGRLNPSKEVTLFVCSRYGAATVTIIPKVKFQ